MTAGTPHDRPTRFLVSVGQNALARWVLWLVDALRKRPGAEVRVRVVAVGEPNSSLSTLLTLERVLGVRRRPGGAERIGKADLGEALLEPAGFRPDVVIDHEALRATRDRATDLPASATERATHRDLG